MSRKSAIIIFGIIKKRILRRYPGTVLLRFTILGSLIQCCRSGSVGSVCFWPPGSGSVGSLCFWPPGSGSVGSVGSVCFWPPGSGSVSQRYGCGSFYHQADIIRKNMIPTAPWPFYDFLSLKKDLNVTFKK
jgi:hypothetical protein